MKATSKERIQREEGWMDEHIGRLRVKQSSKQITMGILVLISDIKVKSYDINYNKQFINNSLLYNECLTCLELDSCSGNTTQFIDNNYKIGAK